LFVLADRINREADDLDVPAPEFGLDLARYPSSVVQTGVKSLGCDKSTAQESPIQWWKAILPWVVSASKSGAMSPSERVIRGPPS
jgi:hypothetical protein